MNAPVARVSRYFLDLGFYPGQIELGGRLTRKRLAWSISAYLLLFFGLFCQQCIDINTVPIRFSPKNAHWAVFAGSAIVGVALFPLFTYWFNRKRKEPSWEHVLWAFSFGFFVNLSSKVLWKMFF